MVYSIAYRRPQSQVSLAGASLEENEKQRSIDESINSAESCLNQGIPNALSFDRIISGGVCPPCTVRDFMNYLRYIEISAENLQFFLWYRNYCDRFSRLPLSEKALSPEWIVPLAEIETTGYSLNRLPKTLDPRMFEMFRNTDFADGRYPVTVDPFRTPNKTPSLNNDEPVHSFECGSSMDGKTQTSIASHHSVAQRTFEEAGVKWKPFTTQPYRDEIDRIIAIYLSKGGPRELNLSARERTAVLHALQNTTHPSALQSAIVSVEYTLRRQAHPNFIRWTICNGNPARVGFARGLGVSTIAMGLLADLLITLSGAGSRAWRLIPFIAWFVGVATLIAACKGMCVVLHGLHHRHLRPWELFAEEGEVIVGGAAAPSAPPALEGWAATRAAAMTGGEKAVAMSDSISASSLLSSSTNSFEDEPWVPRYKRRNVIRKIFDREIWVQEPALRQIQDTIFLQALLAASLLACLFVGIFCAVPRGNFF